MNSILEYKGFNAKIEIDFDNHILHGRIKNISDLVTFESESVAGIIVEFHSAVNDYLEFCAEVGKEPAYEERITAIA